MKAPIPESGCIDEVARASSAYTSTLASDWEPAGTEGFWVKRLYEDETRGEATWLMRMDAGAHSPPHAHEAFEQVYVLDGSFYDDDRLVRAGEYCARAPGAVHSATSDEGATMLVIYTRA